MTARLTTEDLDLILQALEYQKQAFADYKDYPSNELRRIQNARVESIIEKIRVIQDARPR